MNLNLAMNQEALVLEPLSVPLLVSCCLAPLSVQLVSVPPASFFLLFLFGVYQFLAEDQFLPHLFF